MVVVGLVAGLWIWGALQRWSAPPPRFPTKDEVFGKDSDSPRR